MVDHLDSEKLLSFGNRLLRTDFLAFVGRVFVHLHTGQAIKHGWHIEAICHHLLLVEKGEIARLQILVPPRHLKSIITSVAYPAWLIGKKPGLRVLVASYGDDLASKHGKHCRSVMESPWYKAAFPEVELTRAVAEDLETTKGGGRKAVSLGGAVTGFGADLIIIDDLMKAADANSVTERQRVRDYYSQTLYSRLNDKQQGRIISIQQRLHEDDLASHLADSGTFTELILPAIADQDEEISIGSGKSHFRSKDEVLFPAKEPLETLATIRRAIGDYAFAAQYLQNPVPPGGNKFRLEWIQTYDEGDYDECPEREDLLSIVQSYDTAVSEEPTADYSVCSTFGLRKDGKWLLLDIDRQRLSYPDLRQRMIAKAKHWNTDVLLIEKAGTGIAIIQDLFSANRRHELQLRKTQIIGILPKGDKESRFLIHSARIREGDYLFPKNAPWMAHFKHELMAFPAGRHDDQVDSISQFMTWVQSRNGHGHTGTALNGGRPVRPRAVRTRDGAYFE